ncbi:MAG: CHASE2 domain-containing protein [Cyanobacteriota bacterium]|nr:CHASE2 domain-containing protein [Cyanobacteriota bacterium]
MCQLVVLNLGRGNWSEGFATVSARIGNLKGSTLVKITGSLPSAPHLWELYARWQFLYSALAQYRFWRRGGLREAIEIEDEDDTNFSMVEFDRLGQQLHIQLDRWLASESFSRIDRQLRTHLHPRDEIRVILETEDDRVRQFPWHLWSFFEDFPRAEVALSLPEYQHVPHPISPSGDRQVRILAILGDSTGIDLGADKQLLEELPGADLLFLQEPQRQALDEALWDKRGWDILFFAGHSQTEEETGRIYINPTDSLTIPQLKNALKKAIERGLQLAIFNSCDGLGLARSLSDLNIPQPIVMREPVSDRVAQAFLKYFLAAFASGESVYLSVREARERLQGLEGEFPGASWLPVICQNPAVATPTWESLCGGEPRSQEVGDSPDRQVTMVFTDLVNSTAVKNYLPGNDIQARNRLYFNTILQPHRHRVEACLREFGGRVVKTEGDAYFLTFTSAAQAAQWSISLQKSHRDDPIPTPLGSLQVRIGMHTGSPLPDGDDFIGQEVDYAARVSGLAKPEQILLSEVTAVFVRSARIAGLTLHSRGRSKLKGIGNVPIYELVDGNRAELSGVDRPKFGRRGAISSAIVTVAVAGIRLLGLLEPLELKAFDYLMRWQPAEPADKRILVVGADEEDVRRYGFPIPDAVLAQLIEALERHEPAAIGLDLIRDVPVEPGHLELVAQFQQHENLIAPCAFGEDLDSSIAPPPALPEVRVGYIDLENDSTVSPQDYTVRRYLLSRSPNPIDRPSRCSADKSLAWKLIYQYFQTREIPVTTQGKDWKFGSVVAHRLQSRSSGYQTLDARGNQLPIRYRNTPQIAQEVTIRDVLEGGDRFNPDWARDRIVLVGIVASSIQDYHKTPYGRMRGLYVHAHTISQILSTADPNENRPLIWWWPVWGDLLWIGVWSLAGGAIVWYARSPKSLGIAIGLGAIVLYASCWAILTRGGWIPLVPAAIASIGTGVSLAIDSKR